MTIPDDAGRRNLKPGDVVQLKIPADDRPRDCVILSEPMEFGGSWLSNVRFTPTLTQLVRLDWITHIIGKPTPDHHDAELAALRRKLAALVAAAMPFAEMLVRPELRGDMLFSTWLKAYDDTMTISQLRALQDALEDAK